MLQDIIRKLNSELLYPVIGLELEFYLLGIETDIINDKFSNLQPEESEDQYEFTIDHSDNIEQIIISLNERKERIAKLAKECGGEAIFSPKPFKNKAGNGLHVHISLLQKGKNLYSKPQKEESKPLLHSIGGLCSNMIQDLKCFMKSPEDMDRFKYYDMNTPTCISWGNNNRTTAIRIIPSSNNPDSRRIEYRVPGAGCDPELVLDKVLNSIYKGITEQIMPPAPVYGIAYDSQYGLDKFYDILQDAS